MTGIVFIDLRKAFDTVSIPILMKTLPIFGVTGVELEWFESNLTDFGVHVLMANCPPCDCRSYARVHFGPLAFYPVFK